MPVFQLDESIKFPPVGLSEEDGLLAVGGDLSPGRILEAYRRGIFPWFSRGGPILWWSPDPRFVLFPDELRISRSMRQVMERKLFSVTFDASFAEVIEACSQPRRKERDTWITDEMKEAYVRLHDMGYAHSIEAWKGSILAGGLYGVSLGRVFFGESMFARVSNASKAAFITLVSALRERGFSLIDCQVHTAHLESLGARFIPRGDFLGCVSRGLAAGTLCGNWGELLAGDVRS